MNNPNQSKKNYLAKTTRYDIILHVNNESNSLLISPINSVTSVKSLNFSHTKKLEHSKLNVRMSTLEFCLLKFTLEINVTVTKSYSNDTVAIKLNFQTKRKISFVGLRI